MILARYRADVVQYLNVTTNFPVINFRYILLPVWLCGYSFKEKLYKFLVNGRTGKSTGKAPVSALRVIIAVLLGLGVAALIIWLLRFTGVIDLALEQAVQSGLLQPMMSGKFIIEGA